MRSIPKPFTAALAALALFAATGCEESATPPTAEETATEVANQKAAMEKFHATNKSGKMKADGSAKPAEAPAETSK